MEMIQKVAITTDRMAKLKILIWIRSIISLITILTSIKMMATVIWAMALTKASINY